MSPNKESKPAREKFELSHGEKKPGRVVPRAMLRRSTDEPLDSASAAAKHHSDQPSVDSFGQPPKEDRAG